MPTLAKKSHAVFPGLVGPAQRAAGAPELREDERIGAEERDRAVDDLIALVAGIGRAWWRRSRHRLKFATRTRRNGDCRFRGPLNDPGGPEMKRSERCRWGGAAAACLLAAAGLAGCANMSEQDKSTAIGAGVGAVGGSVLTGGSVGGTVGGAAVGGVVGHEVGKDKKK